MESPLANPYSSPAANLYGSTSGGAADAVSPSTIAILSATKPWVRFMSVLMWIGVVLMLLVAAGMGVISSLGVAKSMPSNAFGGVQLIVLAVIYGIFAFIYIFPALKLWKYANRIVSLGATRSVADLDAALNEQRSFWKFIGVMMIILLCLYVVAIIGVVAVGATAAMKAGALPH